MKSAKCENCRRRAEEEKHSQMNIYHVSQDENGQYDTFSDFVVVAKDAKIARSTHPCGHEIDWRRVRKAERKYRIYKGLILNIATNAGTSITKRPDGQARPLP